MNPPEKAPPREPVSEESPAKKQLQDSHLRSALKAVSWRLIGTIDTMVISYLWTGQGGKALAIGGSEVLTKIGLYYLHERAWAKIPLGTVRKLSPFSESQSEPKVPLRDSNLRSLLKALSWRVLGTLDTIVVSYFWTRDTTKALIIGGTDMVTKIFLYYLHERAWSRIPLGTLRRIVQTRSET